MDDAKEPEWFRLYPPDLKRLEDAMVRERREHASADPSAPTLGLALSGGGIRSATLGLGLLQAMACRGTLRAVDFLSTVSGGSYIGSFFCALISRTDSELDGLKPPATLEKPVGIDWAEHALSDGKSEILRWLRDNGRYLAPNGAGDILASVADAVRGWATVQALLFTALLASMTAAAVFEEHVRFLTTPVAWLLLGYQHASFGAAIDPYLVLTQVGLLAVPALMLAYWLTTDWKQRGADVALLVTILVGALWAVGILNGDPRPHPAVTVLAAGPVLALALSYDRGTDYKADWSRDKGLRRATTGLAYSMVFILAAGSLTALNRAGQFLVGSVGIKADAETWTAQFRVAAFGAAVVAIALASSRVVLRFGPALRSRHARNAAAAALTVGWLLALCLAAAWLGRSFEESGDGSRALAALVV